MRKAISTVGLALTRMYRMNPDLADALAAVLLIHDPEALAPDVAQLLAETFDLSPRAAAARLAHLVRQGFLIALPGRPRLILIEQARQRIFPD